LYWALRKRENEYDDVLALARAVLDEPELYQLPGMIMDSCFGLLEKASYTLKNVDNNDMSITCARLWADMVLEQQKILTWLVETLVMKPFFEVFNPILEELCGPLEELVPEDLADFLSPTAMVTEMAEKAMASALQACIGTDKPGDKLVKIFKDRGSPVDEAKAAALAGSTTSAATAKEEEKAAYEIRPSVVPKEEVDSDEDEPVPEEKAPEAPQGGETEKAAEPAPEAPEAEAAATDEKAAE